MKKSKLVLIILFALIVGIGLGAGAATLFASDQVLYKDSTTVKGALDDLYSKVNYGNATAAQILSGKTALVGGNKVTGSMLNISTKKVATLTSSDTRPVLQQRRQSGDAKVWAIANSDGTSRLGYEIPQVGYVPSGTIVGVPYADVAGAIGLTAAKIVKGNTILGIAGTGSSTFYTASATYSTHQGARASNSGTLSFSLPSNAEIVGIASVGFGNRAGLNYIIINSDKTVTVNMINESTSSADNSITVTVKYILK